MTELQCTGVARRFGSTLALVDASVRVRSGEVVALLGPNGSGKTTLLECAAGLTTMDAGSVTCDGEALTASRRSATLFFLSDGITPWRAQPAGWLLRFAATVFGCDTRIRDDVFSTLRIAELGSQPIGTLSKGQRKRLLLAMALLSVRPIVLLDEPFDGLDLRSTRATIALLRRLAAEGRAFMLSMHAMTDAERVADRLVLLHEGRTIGDGTLTELRARIARPDASLEEVVLALS